MRQEKFIVFRIKRHALPKSNLFIRPAMSSVILSCAVLFIASPAQSARILGIFMTPSYSHQVVYQPIWKELSLRGHEMVVLSPNPLKDPTLINLTEIDLGSSYEVWNGQNIATLGTKEHSTSEEIQSLSKAYFEVTEIQMQNPEVQALINDKSQHFDLIIVEFLWPFMYAFKDLYGCPMVGVTSLGLTTSGYASIGNPHHPALNPDIVLPFSSNLSFKERVISTIFNMLYKISAGLKLYPRMNNMVAEHFPGRNIRPIQDIAKDVSLILVNNNLALRSVKPIVPAYVEISGIHLQEKKPLPEDLQRYLDNATEGVIYFSLGSNVKSELLPLDKREAFLKAFSELPYKILWKFENEHLPNQPENVEIRKWLPQQDLLGHPNIKLFITQGGLQSLDEAVDNMVPVISIPFFGDQRYNTHHLVEKGAANYIDFHNFSPEEMKEKIIETITNPKYKNTIKKLGRIARDHPMSALEKSIYWIEYVLRHDGAPHLKYAAVDMSLYQYFLLDVAAFLICALALAAYILLRIFEHVKLCYHIFKRTLLFLTTQRKLRID